MKHKAEINKRKVTRVKGGAATRATLTAMKETAHKKQVARRLRCTVTIRFVFNIRPF
jgi:hypothetical protein